MPSSFLAFFSQQLFSNNLGKIKKIAVLTFFCIEMSNSDPYMLQPDLRKTDCFLPTEHLSLQKALQNYLFKQQNKEFFYRQS